MLELPNGTITVLHTDVQDSTPDAARGAVRRGIGDPPRPLATWVLGLSAHTAPDQYLS